MTVVFLSGKGTLSICGVTQFKELQCKDISVKQGFRLEVLIHYNTSILYIKRLPYPSLESQVLLFIITAVVAENPFVQTGHYQLLHMLHYQSDLRLRKT